MNRQNRIPLSLLLLAGTLLAACGSGTGEATSSAKSEQKVIASPEPGSKLFTELGPEHTGIDFANTITENDRINFYGYQYMYNGGGVAIGDLNNDGLDDVYFTGNMVGDRLYKNNGNLQFEDVTEKDAALRSAPKSVAEFIEF